MSRIESLTFRILKELNILKAPINIIKVADLLGVKVKMNDIGEDVSGFLVTKNGKSLIGINPFESKQRQRFTIAHELGHYQLHTNKSKKDSFFVSKIHFRDPKSATGNYEQEVEANAFAAALLMPKPLLVGEIENLPLNISAEDAIAILAKKFQVSTIAMTYRIERLRLFV